MLYNDYGKTGISVSRLGFGAMRFEDVDDKEKCTELLLSAYEAGINYFDTAPGYFEGKSELRFGDAFKEMKKTRTEKPFYVSTKTTAADPDEIRKECEQSLERMGLDYIDFYHVWYLTSLEEYKGRKAAGVIRGFEKLKEEGLIRNIAVSSHLPGDEVGFLLKDYGFEGVLLGYSAMNYKYREAAIATAASLQNGVAVMNPLGGGVIPGHPELFSFLNNRKDETVVEGALRFLFNDSRINIVLVGMENKKHLDEALSSVNGFSPLSQEVIKAIKDGLSGAMDRICTGCGYCLQVCPENIPISKDMLSYNSYMLEEDKKGAFYDSVRWAHQIHETHGLDRCTECRACEEACTQHLPIMDRFEEMRTLIADHDFG